MFCVYHVFLRFNLFYKELQTAPVSCRHRCAGAQEVQVQVEVERGEQEEQVHRCRCIGAGAELQSCRGSRGAEVRRCGGAEVRRCRGVEV